MCKSSYDKDKHEKKDHVSNASKDGTTSEKERNNDSQFSTNMNTDVETCKSLVVVTTPYSLTVSNKTSDTSETGEAKPLHAEVKDSRIPSKADIQQTASRIGSFFSSAIVMAKNTTIGEKIISKISEVSPTVERVVQQATLISDKKELLETARSLLVEIPHSAMRENSPSAYETIQSKVYEAVLERENTNAPVSPAIQSTIDKFNAMRTSGEISNERSVLGDKPLGSPNQILAEYTSKMITPNEARVQSNIIQSILHVERLIPEALEQGKLTPEEAKTLTEIGFQYAMEGNSSVETFQSIQTAIRYLDILKSAPY